MVFLGDIAFYMGLIALAAGVFLLHHSSHHQGSGEAKLLKIGGYFITVVSLLGLLCTGYYWIKYFASGAFESPSGVTSQFIEDAREENIKISKYKSLEIRTNKTN